MYLEEIREQPLAPPGALDLAIRKVETHTNPSLRPAGVRGLLRMP